MGKPYQEKLKKNKLKTTPKRKAIVELFLKKGTYATPEEVWRNLKPSFSRLGLPTIYRNLEQFVNAGILVRIEGKERRLYYGLCQAKNSKRHHHHITCRRCNRVYEVTNCNFSRLITKIEKETGFKVTGHSLQIEGICANCQKI